MSSLSLGFILQQELPLWVLSIITLFLYEAQPNIGNKYSNIILLLVSYISIISNFRLNNVTQQSLTFFEAKSMFLTLVPILLTISTAIDYYNMDLFNNRSDQIQNPFAIASVIIVDISFILTLLFLQLLWFSKFLCEEKPKPVRTDKLIDWANMMDLQWGNDELVIKINNIIDSSELSGPEVFPSFISRYRQTIDNGKVGSREAPIMKRKGPTVIDS